MTTHQASSYTVLPVQAQEDTLHFSRLLQVEERPFIRLTRNLISPTTLIKWTTPEQNYYTSQQQQATPPPEDGEGDPNEKTAASAEAFNELLQQRKLFRESLLLDFASLTSSLQRLQLLLTANQLERERYAETKDRITRTSASVRSDTSQLRQRLAEARKNLELRKGYDDLAAKLINPEVLKSRRETGEAMRVLETEIAELEVEGRELDVVWAGRREGFERVVEEGRELLDLVRGVKKGGDEVDADAEGERDGEGMDVEGATEEVGGKAVPGSRLVSPAPGEGDRTPLPRGEGEIVTSAVGTPQPSQAGDSGDRAPDLPSEIPSKASSVLGSPLPYAGTTDDVEMGEEDPAAAINTSEGISGSQLQVTGETEVLEAEVGQTIATIPAHEQVETMDET